MRAPFVAGAVSSCTIACAFALAACAAGTGGTSASGGAGGGGAPLAGGAGGEWGTGNPGSYPAYANTKETLFGVSLGGPELVTTFIGAFDCIGGEGQDPAMNDLAIDAEGELWGVSSKHVYRLVPQEGAVHCATTLPLSNPTNPDIAPFHGLTFAPAGVLHPDREALIAGNTAGELWEVDTETGSLTPHGTLGNVPADDGHGHAYPLDPDITGDTVGSPWELSGDLVFLANDGDPIGFATVRDCKDPPSSADCAGTDTLVQIDMAKLSTSTKEPVVLAVRGAIVKNTDCADASAPGEYGGTYGVFAWDDRLYGFTKSGAIVEIANTDGRACLVADTIVSTWYGAGVTTLAPVIEPAE